MARRHHKRRSIRLDKRVKRSDRKRPCPSNKRSYKNRGEAEKEADALDLIVYRCELCGDWHLANRLTRTERRRKGERGEALGGEFT